MKYSVWVTHLTKSRMGGGMPMWLWEWCMMCRCINTRRNHGYTTIIESGRTNYERKPVPQQLILCRQSKPFSFFIMLFLQVHCQIKMHRWKLSKKSWETTKQNPQSSELPLWGNICSPPSPSLVIYWHISSIDTHEKNYSHQGYPPKKQLSFFINMLWIVATLQSPK